MGETLIGLIHPVWWAYCLTNSQEIKSTDLFSAYPISMTIFHPYNLILTILSVIAILVLFGFVLQPKDKTKMISISQWNPELANITTPVMPKKKDIKTPSEWVTYTPWCSYIIGCMFLVYLGYHFFVLGKSLDINVLNFLFLTLIIWLYGSPAALLQAVKASTPAAWGVILQFPFYAGIYGIMKYTGLVDTIESWVGVSRVLCKSIQ